MTRSPERSATMSLPAGRRSPRRWSPREMLSPQIRADRCGALASSSPATRRNWLAWEASRGRWRTASSSSDTRSRKADAGAVRDRCDTRDACGDVCRSAHDGGDRPHAGGAQRLEPLPREGRLSPRRSAVLAQAVHRLSRCPSAFKRRNKARSSTALTDAGIGSPRDDEVALGLSGVGAGNAHEPSGA